MIRYRLRELRRALSPTQFVHNLLHRGQSQSVHPIPPSYLRVLAIATADLPAYLESGRRTARAMAELLDESGVDHRALGSVLEFGCGAGRVLRHLPEWGDLALWGSDRNRLPIRWCARNLTFAKFFHNADRPPLPFEDGQFDFVYALSVFTHLPGPLESQWLDELERVLRPGGLLLVTLRGAAYLPRLDAGQRECFDRGELVVRNPGAAGWNECDGYHPRAHVERTYLSRFQLVAHLESPPAFAPRAPAPGKDPGQDVYLLRKPGP